MLKSTHEKACQKLEVEFSRMWRDIREKYDALKKESSEVNAELDLARNSLKKLEEGLDLAKRESQLNNERFNNLYASMSILLGYIREGAHHMSFNSSFKAALSSKHTTLLYGIIRGDISNLDQAVSHIQKEDEE